MLNYLYFSAMSRIVTDKKILITLTLIFSASVNCAEVNVAASANLTYVMPVIAGTFEQQTGNRLRLTLGSTRSMVYQLIRGAPFEVFLSADDLAVKRLQSENLHQGDSVVYATGQLCFFAGKQSGLRLSADLVSLKEAFGKEGFKYFAIANPETAPYGAIAMKALQKAGVFEVLKGSLVFGDNAAQTAQFALSGSVDAALLPCSMTQMPALKAQGQALPVAATLYDPLRQSMLLLKGAGESAASFFQFMQTPEVKNILLEHGYLAP